MYFLLVGRVGQYRVRKVSLAYLAAGSFFGEVELLFETETSAPVEGVSIAIAHLDGDTGAIDAKYDPVVTGVTDLFGAFATTMRVTDQDWTALSQHFVATYSKTSTFETPAGETVMSMMRPERS